MAAERSVRFPALAYFGAGASILALAAAIGVPVEIRNAACIATSFPDFADRWSEAFGTSVSVV